MKAGGTRRGTSAVAEQLPDRRYSREANKPRAEVGFYEFRRQRNVIAAASPRLSAKSSKLTLEMHQELH